MVGEILYTYDQNRRSYLNDDGTKRSSPNPKSYWEAHTVTGETRICWILDNGKYKVDKKTLELRGIREFYAMHRYAYTPEQMQDKFWEYKNRFTVQRAVENADVPTLRKIAALLGIAD